MSFPSKTLDQIVRRGLAHGRTSFPGFPLGIKSFLGRNNRSTSLQIWGLHKSVEDVTKDMIPQPQSSTDALDEWAFELGLPDGAGGYGRKKPVAASGGAATLTGVKGTVYPDQATATAEDGITQIKLSGSVSIPGSGTGFGSIPGKFVAVTPGAAGNLPIGTRCTWDNTPTGADGSFLITSPLEKGADQESNASLYGRIVQAMQTPAGGGRAQDFRNWLGAISGLGPSYVYPKRSGTGTTDVVITTGGSGQARVPSATQLDDAQTALDANTPESAEWSKAVLPWAPDGRGHVVTVKVSPAGADFAFDWDDTAGALAVASYSAGPPGTIDLTGHAPDSLRQAIADYIAGTREAPRIQVIATGAVINPPVAVTAYTDLGAADRLTLGEIPSSWTAPTASDAIYAYGPVVATIAAGILALCDSLGPSRASGYADAITTWRDKLTISGIIGVAQDAIDENGSSLIDEVEPGDATIDGVAQDVQGIDGVNGPEILYLEHVLVVAA